MVEFFLKFAYNRYGCDRMKYYCIGIKGAGMSTLAQILFDLGHEVSGYDDTIEYKFTEEGLKKRNIPIYHDQSHEIDKDTIVTFSKAFSMDHKEIKRVKELGLTIESYHDLLGKLTKEFKTIAVSGTHGKTTTSSLITHILKKHKGVNYFIGDGTGYASRENSLFVIESCEYQKHFLAYYPTVAVITNIELEHTECYDGIEDIIHTFETFANKAELVVACGDDQNVRKMNIKGKTIYYGFQEDNDLVAKNIYFNQKGSSFDVYLHQKFYGHFDLPLYGEHMVLNTLATIAVCNLEEVTKEEIHDELLTFVNAKRRFKEEVVGDNIIIDDYAHHPTEIAVTIKAARQKYQDREIVAVFKPNTYSRTKEMYSWFADVLNLADVSYVTPIDCNREKKEDYDNVTSNLIIDKLNNGYLLKEEDVSILKKHNHAVICFMSCADVSHLIKNYKKLYE